MNYGKSWSSPINPLSRSSRNGLQNLGRRHAIFFKTGNPAYVLPLKFALTSGNYNPRYGRRSVRAAAVINRYARRMLFRNRIRRPASQPLFPNYKDYEAAWRTAPGVYIPPNKGWVPLGKRKAPAAGFTSRKMPRGTNPNHFPPNYVLRGMIRKKGRMQVARGAVAKWRKFVQSKRQTSAGAAKTRRRAALAVGRFQHGGRFDERTYVSKWFKPFEHGYNKIDWKNLREKKLYHRVEETSFEFQSHVGEQGSYGVALLDNARVKYILNQDPLTDGITLGTTDGYEFMNRLYMKSSYAKFHVSNSCNVPIRIRITVYDYIANNSKVPVDFYNLDRQYTGYPDRTSVANPDGTATTINSTYDLNTVPGAYPMTSGFMKQVARIRYQKDMLLNVGNNGFFVVPTQWNRKIVNPIDVANTSWVDPATKPPFPTDVYIKNCSSLVYMTIWSNTLGSTSTGTALGTNQENLSQGQATVKVSRVNQWYVADTISVKRDFTRYIATVIGAAVDANLNVMQDNNQQSAVFRKT